MEEKIRRNFEERENNDTQHMSPNIGDGWELFESGNMAHRNPSKSSSHDAHRQDDKNSSGHSRLLGDGTRSRDSSLVDEGSLTSEQVENSAKSDRRRRHRQKASETSHHGQHSRSRYRHNRPSQERKCDTCDSDSHHDDRDTYKYCDQRSSLDGRKPCYEPRQLRRHSPSVVRDRHRVKGRRSLSHTNT